MRPLLLLFSFVCICNALNAQYVYTINADSVKITNHCDTAGAIPRKISTQTVPGFLFNQRKRPHGVSPCLRVKAGHYYLP